MTESQLSKKIVDALRRRGAWAVKTHGDPRQRRGLPDVLACYKSFFIGLEVKLPPKRENVTKLQRDTLDRIRAAEGEAIIVTSVQEVMKCCDMIDSEL